MKKKNILLDRFKNSSVPYFYDFFKRFNFEVKIISFSENKYPSIKNYDGDLLADSEISRGKYFREVPWVLDSNDMEILSQYQGLLQLVLSRYALSPSYWSSHEMSTHVFMLLNYWKYKLVSKKVEVCFAFYAPHDPASFSLYVMTKILKIPYIFIDMPVVAQKIRFLSCSFKYRNLLINETDNEIPNWAKKILIDYHSKIKNNFSSSVPPSTYENYLTSKEKKTTIFNRLKINIYRGNVINKIKSKLKFRLPSKTYFKYNRHEWYSKKSDPNWIFRYLEDIKIFWRISYRSYHYKKICSSFENEVVGSRYIYFPAPLSPEGSNIPVALWNSDIKISILKLLSAIPKDCKIVYKAGPLQFKKSYIRQFSTFPDWFTANFYYDLLKTGRVSFVTVDTSTEDLIKHSMGVASINGSVTSEAISLGKHAIIFSPMWYDALAGVHYCKNQEDLDCAISLMKKNDIPKPDFSNIKMSSSAIFEANEFIANDFSKDLYKIIAEKFLSSYKIFDKLDNKKWSI